MAIIFKNVNIMIFLIFQEEVYFDIFQDFRQSCFSKRFYIWIWITFQVSQQNCKLIWLFLNFFLLCISFSIDWLSIFCKKQSKEYFPKSKPFDVKSSSDWSILPISIWHNILRNYTCPESHIIELHVLILCRLPKFWEVVIFTFFQTNNKPLRLQNHPINNAFLLFLIFITFLNHGWRQKQSTLRSLCWKPFPHQSTQENFCQQYRTFIKPLFQTFTQQSIEHFPIVILNFTDKILFLFTTFHFQNVMYIQSTSPLIACSLIITIVT